MQYHRDTTTREVYSILLKPMNHFGSNVRIFEYNEIFKPFRRGDP